MVKLRRNYISDEEQIARINSKVGKHDTIIFLGDIGNEEMIRKVRGYKVLIMGNHDKGASKYERKRVYHGYYYKNIFSKQQVFDSMNKRYPDCAIQLIDTYDRWHATADNGLFDEVYEGPLFIAEKLVLSHEPIDLPFAFNIHGHEHCYHWREHHLNVCAERIDYYPLNMNKMLKSGLLSEVDSIHRMTIDRAVERKLNEDEMWARMDHVK